MSRWSLLTLLVTLLSVTPAFGDGVIPPAKTRPRVATPSYSDLNEQTGELRNRLEIVEELMRRIERASDAGERRVLLHAHLRAMSASLRLLRAVERRRAAAGMVSMTENQAIQRRTLLLEDRLEIMNTLIEQMIKHQLAAEATPH